MEEALKALHLHHGQQSWGHGLGRSFRDSYGRGAAGVGSDLDLLLIDTAAAGPQVQRLRHWPLASLPLSCDALVLTPAELQRDLRWLPTVEDGCCG